jgi:hypothetical protein
MRTAISQRKNVEKKVIANSWYNDNAIFAGGFDQEHGRFQGDGKYTWACGRSFVGSFKAGVPHGYGEMRFPKVSCAAHPVEESEQRVWKNYN